METEIPGSGRAARGVRVLPHGHKGGPATARGTSSARSPSQPAPTSRPTVPALHSATGANECARPAAHATDVSHVSGYDPTGTRTYRSSEWPVVPCRTHSATVERWYVLPSSPRYGN